MLAVQIKPHPHFMLFATQNPPGTYGGRKVCHPIARSSSRGTRDACDANFASTMGAAARLTLCGL